MTESDPLDRLEAELRTLRPPGLSATARARVDARLRRDRLARAWPLAAAAAVLAIGLTTLLWHGRRAPSPAPGSQPPLAGGDRGQAPDPGVVPTPERPLSTQLGEGFHPSSLWALRRAVGDPERDLDALLARRAAAVPSARDATTTPLGRGLGLGLLQ